MKRLMYDRQALTFSPLHGIFIPPFGRKEMKIHAQEAS